MYTNLTGGASKTFVFSLYCTAHQHQAQRASYYRHGQPATMDILENLLIRESADLGFAANSHFDILKIHLKECRLEGAVCDTFEEEQYLGPKGCQQSLWLSLSLPLRRKQFKKYFRPYWGSKS